MNSPATSRRKLPYAIAFAVHELVLIRSWAERNGMLMKLRLDQVVDGEEFEELVLLCRRGSTQPVLSLWRKTNAVVVQRAGGAPRSHGGVQAALSQVGLRPPAEPALAIWRHLRAWGLAS
jgi:hypothetical protein